MFFIRTELSNFGITSTMVLTVYSVIRILCNWVVSNFLSDKRLFSKSVALLGFSFSFAPDNKLSQTCYSYNYK